MKRGLTVTQKAAVLRMVKFERYADRQVTMEALVRRGYAVWSSEHQVSVRPTEAARKFATTGEQLNR